MEGGDEGRVSGKDFEHKYFVVGHTVEYTSEEVQKKDGSGSYIKFKKPQQQFGGGGGAKWQPKGKKEYMSDFLGYFTRYATDVLISEGKEVNEENLTPIVHAYFKVAKPLLDKIHE